ncbi:MAG: hypothetical protein OXG79_01960 [Chloroflexi bacterium]|nr:hypothetical protein [Chloroflexota bacterium]MCY4110923.1 hypothetical protein [Chloroflexota bacterium]
MQSSLISKVQKAHKYAQEPHRIHFEALTVRFDGDNNDHVIRLADGAWSCDCEFFMVWQTCSHTMALEKLLEGMVPVGSASAAG